MPKPKHPPPHREPKLKVQRVQTGVRIEKRLLKVLKAIAEYHDLSLGDLLSTTTEILLGRCSRMC